MGTLSRDRLKQMIDDQEKFTLIDALPKEKYAQSHLPGAISMPPESVRDLAPKLLQDKDAKIVTYCASSKCPASAKAAQELESLGYTNVHEYVEGKEDWLQAGFPLDGSAAPETAHEGGSGSDTGFREDADGVADAVSTHTLEDMESAHTGTFEPEIEQPKPGRDV